MDSAMFEQVNLQSKKNLTILKLKFSNIWRGLKAEITFKRENQVLVPTKEQVIDQYVIEYPIAKPLYLIIRCLLHKMSMDDPATGGLTSFALFLMIIAVIQVIEFKNQEKKMETHQPQNTLINAIRPTEEHRTSLRASLIKKSSFEHERFKQKILDAFSEIEFHNIVSLFDEHISQKISKKEQKKSLDSNKAEAERPNMLNSIGSVLLYFFKVYGFHFDYHQYLIRPNMPKEPNIFPFRPKEKNTAPILAVMIPYAIDIDICKNFFLTAELKALCKLSYIKLFTVCSCKFQDASLESLFGKLNVQPNKFNRICRQPGFARSGDELNCLPNKLLIKISGIDFSNVKFKKASGIGKREGSDETKAECSQIVKLAPRLPLLQLLLSTSPL